MNESLDELNDTDVEKESEMRMKQLQVPYKNIIVCPQ